MQRRKKNDSYESANALSKGLELPLRAFKTGIFPFRPAQGKELKLITPKEFQQHFHRYNENTSENLLKEIRQIRYSLY